MGIARTKLIAAVGWFVLCFVFAAAAAVAGWLGAKVLGPEITLPLLFICSLAFVLLFFYLRHRQTGTWSYGVRRFDGEVSGHRIKLEFDERLIEPNQLRLFVDDQEVASDKIFFGTKDLRARTRDGTDLSVKVQSGWLGTTGATISVADSGASKPLIDRSADNSAVG